MGCHQNKCRYYSILFISTILLVSGLEETLAMRPLEGEKWLINALSFQQLPRGQQKPPTPNPCTNIPGSSSRGRCTLSQMNVAGRQFSHAKPPVFPHHIVDFVVSSAVAHDDHQIQNH